MTGGMHEVTPPQLPLRSDPAEESLAHRPGGGHRPHFFPRNLLEIASRKKVRRNGTDTIIVVPAPSFIKS
jgi:hypothetical protein